MVERDDHGWADVVVQQDSSVRGAAADDPRNRDPMISPWASVGVELGNASLDRLWVYDDGRKDFTPQQIVTSIAAGTACVSTR